MKQPNPGSKEAIKLGCICPVYDNSNGEGYMGMKDIFVYTEGCKVHGLKKVKSDRENKTDN